MKWEARRPQAPGHYAGSHSCSGCRIPGRATRLPGAARRAALPILAATVALAGCAVGPDYKRPALKTPASYRFATGEATNSLGDLPWWEVFRDPALQKLIRCALTNNHDLRRAVARVEQARQQVTVARAPLFPAIGYGGDVGRGKHAIVNSMAAPSDATVSSAQVNLNAVWEIDFWGRIRRLTESARAQYLSTEAARRGVTITLVSDVATAYFALLDLDQELAIQRAATNAYAGSYRIFDDRRAKGVASKLETDRAAAALANAAAEIPLLELQIATTENQINLLLGQNPGRVPRGSLTNQPPFPAAVPAGLPSSLLQRRPDILQAEQSLIAANANIGASFANFFPQIGLTTFLGKISPELSAYSGGAANAWNVGATLAGPLFQGGQLRAQYRAAKASFDEAKAAYEQTVLIAFREVSDTLVTREKYAEAGIFNAEAVAALTSAVDLATERYLNGKSSYYEVLQAQQELYPTQRSKVQTQVSELLSIIALYKALGGGWEPSILWPDTH
jgi:outer membrane protein, multidrug efflux system